MIKIKSVQENVEHNIKVKEETENFNTHTHMIQFYKTLVQKKQREQHTFSEVK